MIIGLMLRRVFGGGSEQLISGTDEFALPGMNEGKIVQKWNGIMVSPSYALPLRRSILSHGGQWQLMYANLGCESLPAFVGSSEDGGD
jgi:hypothetical protein